MSRRRTLVSPSPEPRAFLPARVGDRVTLRYRLGQEGPTRGPTLTDVVGELVALTPETVTVAGRHGQVTVPRVDVVGVRVVPPRATRTARPHLALEPVQLQELMVAGHPPLERQWLGRWLLRAAGGFTGRANSLLPLGDPGVPLDEAMARVEAFYAERRLPSQATIYSDRSADDPLRHVVDLLEGRGYRGEQETRTLTLDLGRRPVVEHNAVMGYAVRRDSTLTPEYLAVATRVAQAGEVGKRVVTGNPDAVFLTVLDGSGTPVGALRLAMHDGWAGVFDLAVVQAHRRRGLARLLMGDALHIADTHRLVACYLQVEADNQAAGALYEALGFVEHHRYRYYRRPGRR